jgi:tRNA-dihydrouridine synthase C
VSSHDPLADWRARSPLVRSGQPILILAPMEGISDFIVRELLSSLGGMDLAVTEFIRVARRPVPRQVLLRECPELARGGRTSSGTPVIVQLLGGEPDLVAESARSACEIGALGIDLNFGCPARKVNGSDGGAVLLKAPHRITEVVAATRRACPSRVTVSAKIRLGWEDPNDVVRCAKAAEAGGADWITIHARTKMQMYKPFADWTRIAAAAREVKVPVVANGDIFSPEALERCRTVTGSSAFMLGRGAFRTPNLFRMIRGLDHTPWSMDRLVALLVTFAARVSNHPDYDDPRRAALNRLKGWTGAIAEVSDEMAAKFEILKRTQALEDAFGVLETGWARPAAAARSDSFLPCT